MLTYAETDRGSDPYPQGFPPYWSMVKVVLLRNIHTTQNGTDPHAYMATVPILGTGIRVRLHV